MINSLVQTQPVVFPRLSSNFMRIKDWPVLIVISLPPSTLPRDFQSLIQSNPAHLSNFIVFFPSTRLEKKQWYRSVPRSLERRETFWHVTSRDVSRYFEKRILFLAIQFRTIRSIGSAVYARGCLIPIANQSEQLRPLNYRNSLPHRPADDHDGSISSVVFKSPRIYLS